MPEHSHRSPGISIEASIYASNFFSKEELSLMGAAIDFYNELGTQTLLSDQEITPEIDQNLRNMSYDKFPGSKEIAQKYHDFYDSYLRMQNAPNN